MPIRLLGKTAVMSSRLQMFLPRWPRGVIIWGVYGIVIEVKVKTAVETILGKLKKNTAKVGVKVTVTATLV